MNVGPLTPNLHNVPNLIGGEVCLVIIINDTTLHKRHSLHDPSD